jgi:hypothetical protein
MNNLNNSTLNMLLRQIKPFTKKPAVAWILNQLRFVRSALFKTTLRIRNITHNNTSRQFSFRDKQYPYFMHAYHDSWVNERCIEIPIFKSVIDTYASQDGSILEIGCVMKHYDERAAWTVVDKYETYPGVINEDIVLYNNKKKFDFIFSISTLEHVGFDEEPKNPEKILAAFDQITKVLLSNKGVLMYSIPLGYNEFLDNCVLNNLIPFDDIVVMKRRGLMKWEQVALGKYIKNSYNYALESANYIGVLTYNSK